MKAKLFCRANILLAASSLASMVMAHAASDKVFDWVKSQDEIISRTHLMAGYAGGLACDHLINTDVAAAYINNHFGNRVCCAMLKLGS